MESRATFTRAAVAIEGRTCRVDLPVAGRHQMENALFPMAVAYGLGLDLEAAASACANFRPPARRTERMRIELSGSGDIVEVIDDAYNASPTSVRALLDVLRSRRARRKVLVLGDMLELGIGERELHEMLADDVAGAEIDLVVTVGRLSRSLAAPLAGRAEVISLEDSAEAAKHVLALIRGGDLIALKASAGMNFAQIVAAMARSSVRKAAAGSWAIEDEGPATFAG